MTSVDGGAFTSGPATSVPSPASAVPVAWSAGHAHCATQGSDPSHGGWAYPADPMPEPDRLTRLVNRIAARSPRWAAPVAVLSCVAGAVGYTIVADPTVSAADAPPTCLVKLTTGLNCPGCGGTRAFWYVLHGDLPAAARHHLLFVFILPFLLYFYVVWAGQQLFRWRLPQLRVTPMAIGLFLVGWLAFTMLRNLPWAPFTWFYV